MGFSTAIIFIPSRLGSICFLKIPSVLSFMFLHATSNTCKEESNRPSQSERKETFEKKYLEFEKLEARLLLQLDIPNLTLSAVAIHEAHSEALTQKHFTYDDPETGYKVMTRLSHFYRGKCCGNACRHCVFSHENVPLKVKNKRVFNTSFWIDCEQDSCRDECSTTCAWWPLRLIHLSQQHDDTLLYMH